MTGAIDHVRAEASRTVLDGDADARDGGEPAPSDVSPCAAVARHTTPKRISAAPRSPREHVLSGPSSVGANSARRNSSAGRRTGG